MAALRLTMTNVYACYDDDYQCNLHACCVVLTGLPEGTSCKSLKTDLFRRTSLCRVFTLLEHTLNTLNYRSQ